MCKEKCDKCLNNPLSATLLESVSWVMCASSGYFISYIFALDVIKKSGATNIPDIFNVIGTISGYVFGICVIVYYITMFCALRALTKRLASVDIKNIENIKSK